MKTAPAEMANNVSYISLIKMDGSPPAVLKNTRYVGALSKKLDNIPVNQKYMKLIGSPDWFDTEDTIEDSAPFVPAFNMAIAGMMVTNIPAKSFPTSTIGNHVYSFASLIALGVIVQLIYVSESSNISRMIFCNSR